MQNLFQDWGKCVDPATQVATLRCIPVVFQNTVTALLVFVGATAIVMIVYAGIRFMTSGGDPKNVSQARQIMTFAIVGLVLVLASFGIIKFIGYITNTDCITKFGLDQCAK